MKDRLCFPRRWHVVIGVCMLIGASHCASASVSPVGSQSITDQIPKVDQIRPVLPNRFAHASADAPFRLRCDWSGNPLGIQQRHPRLTWTPPQRKTLLDQVDYQIQVAALPQNFKRDHDLIWDSGKVAENPNFLPQYNGPAFQPYTHYYWRVRVWNRSGWQSQWSRVNSWMTGPLKLSDWHGSWISYQHKISNAFYAAPHNAYYGLPLPKNMIHKSWIQKEPCPIFRKVFRAPAKLRNGYIYVAGLGYWKVLVNGHKVGPGVLYSTLYNYSKTVPYQSFDITSLLRKGRRNVVSIELGNGWYNEMETNVWGWQNAPWRAWPKVRMNLLMRTMTGESTWLATNPSWQAAAGPRLADGVYNGEVYDPALKIRGWNHPDRAMSNLAHATIVAAPTGRLTSQLMPPCQVTQRLAPVSVTEPEPHVFVVKFPQNMSGWVALTAKGKPGVPVVLRYGERLFANGLVNRKPISLFIFNGPFQTDTVIPADHKPFTYHPNFAYNGFQYVQINGLQSKKDIIRIQADYIHTAFHRASVFWCGNPLLNAIADCTNRSYCSNFMGYPTDCPTREKDGWMGDGWLASVQGMMTYNNQLGYAKWLNDMHDVQYPNGALRVIVPDPSGWDWDGGRFPDPDWESAYEFVCWNQYLYYGDGRVLRKHYNDLKRYFRYALSFAPQNILPDYTGLGDWAPAWQPIPPVSFTSTCLLYHDAVLLSRIAAILNHPKDAATFAANAAAIRTAFNKRFYMGHGVYSNGRQTAEAMPLYYGLATAAMRKPVLQCLVRAVHARQNHLDVGVLGAKCLFRILSRYGHTSLAYRIATQTDYPSYGQWILHGATTLWEAFGLYPPSMNHIMYGDILGWMYNDLAGIKPDPMDPGFHTILIDPHPVRALPWAGGVHDCRFGTIRSRWRWIAEDLRLDITIPPATSAIVTLHVAGDAVIRCNGGVLGSSTPGVHTIARSAQKNGPTTVTVGPGQYQFVYRPQLHNHAR